MSWEKIYVDQVIVVWAVQFWIPPQPAPPQHTHTHTHTFNSELQPHFLSHWNALCFEVAATPFLSYTCPHIAYIVSSIFGQL